MLTSFEAVLANILLTSVLATHLPALRRTRLFLKTPGNQFHFPEMSNKSSLVNEMAFALDAVQGNGHV